MEKISVVIPCYNSENSIRKIVEELVDVLSVQSAYDFEIILVNDYSSDTTWDKISEMALNNNKIVAINFSKNFGQSSALLAALNHVTGDYIVAMDDDGENNPSDIMKLIYKINEGYDCVFAEYEAVRTAFREFGSKLNNLMATVLIDKPPEISLSNFYVMRRFIADEIMRYDNAYPYFIGLLLRATQNLGTVPLVRGKRMYGHSGYTFKRLLSLWFNGFTAFSVKPLRIATLLGAISATGGFLGAIVLIIQKLLIKDIAVGYSSIMVSIAFFSGMIMMLLGAIGEYVGRIYICINKAPQYVIKEKVDNRKSEQISQGGE